MYGAHARVSSPWTGSSIFRTSAPRSPSIIVQNGPATTRVKSTTRIPCSGGMRHYPANATDRKRRDVVDGGFDVRARRRELETQALNDRVLPDVDDGLRHDAADAVQHRRV